MRKLLLVALALLPLLGSGQDLPRYDAPHQASDDPDVWQITQPLTGKRFIDVYYTSLPALIAANSALIDSQKWPAEEKRRKLGQDSAAYLGGVLYIFARSFERNAIDGSLTIVVLDEANNELLRRTLAPVEAELTVSLTDYARIYTVPVTKPLPASFCLAVVDNPARQQHEFVVRPVEQRPAPSN